MPINDKRLNDLGFSGRRETEYGSSDDIQVRGLNSDVRSRLKTAVDDAGGPKAVSEAAGVPVSTLQAALRGVSEPKIGLMAAVATVAGVSLDFLVYGTGEKPSEAPKLQEQHPVETVPFYHVRASAGHGAAAFDDAAREELALSKKTLETLGIRASDIVVMTVSGDSAEPTMSSGDFIFVDRTANELRDGGMYVIGIDDDIVVKRVERLIDRSVRLSSDNPRYSPQIVPTGDVERLRVIGRVRWVVHQF